MDPKKPSKKIRVACIELDLTQTQLAEKINAKQKSISRYETGASLPSIKTLVKIAKVLKRPFPLWKAKKCNFLKKPRLTKKSVNN